MEGCCGFDISRSELTAARPRNMEPGESPGQLALLYPVTKSQYANLKIRGFPFEPAKDG